MNMRDIILVSRIAGRWAGEIVDDKTYTLEYDAEEVLAVEAAVSNLSFLSTGGAGSGIIAEGLLVCKVFCTRRGGVLGFEEHRLPLSLLLPPPAPAAVPVAGGHLDPPGPVPPGARGVSIEGEAGIIYVNFAFDPGKRGIYQRTHIRFLIYQVEDASITPSLLSGPGPEHGYPGLCSCPGPHFARYSIMARRPLVETAVTGRVVAAIHLARPASIIESVSVSVADPSFEMAGEGIIEGIVASGRLLVSVLYVDDGNIKRHDLRDDVGFSLLAPAPPGPSFGPPGAGAHADGLAPGARTSSGCVRCEGRMEVSNVSWQVDSGAIKLDVRVELDARVRVVAVAGINLLARAAGDGDECGAEWVEIVGAQTVEARVDAVVAEASNEYIYRVEARLRRRCTRLTSVSAEMTDIETEVMFEEVLVRGLLRVGFYYVGYSGHAGHVGRACHGGHADQTSYAGRTDRTCWTDRADLANQQVAGGDGECNVECHEEVSRKLVRFITAKGARPGMQAAVRVHVTSVDSQYDPGGSRIRETLSITIAVVVTERRELALLTAAAPSSRPEYGAAGGPGSAPEPRPEAEPGPKPGPMGPILSILRGASRLMQLVQVVEEVIRFLGRVITLVTRRIPRE